MRQLFLFLSLFLFSVNLFAADSALNKSAVENLLKQNKSAEAYELISKTIDPASTDPQEWFLLGMAAKKSGHPQEAKKAFEKVLEIDPDAPRVKLELAGICYANGSYDKAKELLLDVKSENPPDGVVQNIDRFLAVIERGKQENKSYRIHLSAGMNYDSNVNAGPQSDTVTLFGLPFILDDVAKPHEDWAYTLDAGIDHVLKVSPSVNWQSSFSLNWKDYFEQNDFDVLMLSASTGPIFSATDKLMIYIPVIGDTYWYNDIDDYFFMTVGVAPQLRYALSPKAKFNLMSGAYNRNYKDDDNRDSWINSVAPGFDFTLNKRLTLRTGLSLGWEEAENDVYTNKNWALNSTLFYALSKDLLATLSGSYGKSFYEAKPAMLEDRRKDEKYSIAFDLRYNYRPWNADIILAASYVDNASNSELYEYDRTNIALRFRKYF